MNSLLNYNSDWMNSNYTSFSLMLIMALFRSFVLSSYTRSCLVSGRYFSVKLHYREKTHALLHTWENIWFQVPLRKQLLLVRLVVAGIHIFSFSRNC